MTDVDRKFKWPPPFDPFIGDRVVAGVVATSLGELQDLTPYHVAVAALAECGRVDLVAALACADDGDIDVWMTMILDLHDNELVVIQKAIRLARQSSPEAEEWAMVWSDA